MDNEQDKTENQHRSSKTTMKDNIGGFIEEMIGVCK